MISRIEGSNMTKQEQFLFIVQTAILANGINLSSRAESSEKYRHEFSATGVLGMLDDSIHASDRIPDNMSAYEAAHEFCNFIFGNLRKENKADGTKLDVPRWFARDHLGR
jgi:hypothetical protein